MNTRFVGEMGPLVVLHDVDPKAAEKFMEDLRGLSDRRLALLLPPTLTPWLLTAPPSAR